MGHRGILGREHLQTLFFLAGHVVDLVEVRLVVRGPLVVEDPGHRGWPMRAPTYERRRRAA